MEEPLDMRDELEQDWGDDDLDPDLDVKAHGMHIEGEEDDEVPIFDEDK